MSIFLNFWTHRHTEIDTELDNFPSSQYNQYISSLIQIRLTEASYVWIVEHKVILSNTILSVILLHVTHVSLHEKKLSEAMGLFAGGQLSEFY